MRPFGIGIFFFIVGANVVQAQELPAPKFSDSQLRWTRSIKPALPLDDSNTQGAAMPGQRVGRLMSESVAQPGVDQGLLPADTVSSNWSVLVADKTLYRTMRRWAQEANYQLMWQIDRDYPIEASVTFETNFRGAVSEVMAGVALTDYPIQAIFNPSARLLRVVRHMDEGLR